MQQYQDLVRKIIAQGADKADRTGTGTRSIFGHQMRFDLTDGFPLVTTKRIHFKSVAVELLWMISGNSSIKPLVDQGVSIWTDWPLAKFNAYRAGAGLDPISRRGFEDLIRDEPGFAYKWGNLGPVYGVQWRAWDGGMEWQGGDHRRVRVDQLAGVIEQIKTNPDSRRLIVSPWNVAQLDQMALPPCHAFFQFYVQGGRLSCQLYQRSADVFLGVPFNIASYALLIQMIAQVTNLQPGELVWTGGDCHLYADHFEQAALLLAREPRPLPEVILNPMVTDIDAFTLADIHLEGYAPHPTIKAKVSV